MLEVAAAIIRKDEKILICQRSANKDLGLLWEFPGGKIEPGETGEQAVIRECREELGVTLKINSFFMDVTHEYPDRTVHLSVYNCSLTDGEPVRLEHNDMQWITASECRKFEFCPADVEIICRLSYRLYPQMITEYVELYKNLYLNEE